MNALARTSSREALGRKQRQAGRRAASSGRATYRQARLGRAGAACSGPVSVGLASCGVVRLAMAGAAWQRIAWPVLGVMVESGWAGTARPGATRTGLVGPASALIGSVGQARRRAQWSGDGRRVTARLGIAGAARSFRTGAAWLGPARPGRASQARSVLAWANLERPVNAGAASRAAAGPGNSRLVKAGQARQRVGGQIVARPGKSRLGAARQAWWARKRWAVLRHCQARRCSPRQERAGSARRVRALFGKVGPNCGRQAGLGLVSFLVRGSRFGLAGWGLAGAARSVSSWPSMVGHRRQARPHLERCDRACYGVGWVGEAAVGRSGRVGHGCTRRRLAGSGIAGGARIGPIGSGSAPYRLASLCWRGALRKASRRLRWPDWAGVTRRSAEASGAVRSGWSWYRRRGFAIHGEARPVSAGRGRPWPAGAASPCASSVGRARHCKAGQGSPGVVTHSVAQRRRASHGRQGSVWLAVDGLLLVNAGYVRN